MLSRMEADFVAGLGDSNPEGRLVSIQRLGNLKLASSLPALHDVIERGSSLEKDWATYAALRIGDPTVLPRVKDMLVRGERSMPTSILSWELSQMRDRRAIPALIEIVKAAPEPGTRASALKALGENLRASEALPAIAECLLELDRYVRYDALNAMRVITPEPACTRNESAWP